MGSLRLNHAELRDALADPDVGAQFSVHSGTSHLVVDVENPVDLGGLPGLGLPCVIVAVADPALAQSCTFADVVLSGEGIDGPTALARMSRTIESKPVAAASYAMLLRPFDGVRAVADRGADSAVFAGLVAESTCYSMLQSGAEFAAWREARALRKAQDSGARVGVTRSGNLLDVVLTRPDKRNALDTAMRDQLVAALGVALAEPQLRVRLSGAGPAFCAGGDLDEFGARRDPAEAHLTRMARSVAWTVHRLRSRIEVDLHGACMGSGIEIPAFAGTVRAREDTTIGLPEVALGLIPGAGGTVSVSRRIGRQRTTFLGLCGTTIDARTALKWGLVDMVRD